MSKGVVFKQRYNSVNVASTPVLNVKHLTYIATRKGAIRNPECNFGLWGRLPGMTDAENIDNFKLAKQTVSQASNCHTLYRVVLSVDKDTAARHDLYRREPWQDLVNRKIDVIAKEMNIERKDFCWAASMHYAKDHPHVHIMYWDSSSKPRQEFVPEARFEIIAERIRSAFGREIYQEELTELRAESKEVSGLVRLQLQAMCREANLSNALDLNHVSVAKLDDLGKQFAALALDLPDRGSLKYAFLPGGYKGKVNAFLDEVMKISDFSRLQTQYIKLTDQISDLYGNGEERKAFNREGAQKKLYTDLGNSVMSAIREYRAELMPDLPDKALELRAVVNTSVRRIAQFSPRYQTLADLMPKLRTPMRVIAEGQVFRDTKDELVKELCRDLRIRTLLQSYVKAHFEGEELTTPSKTEARRQFETDARHDLYKAVDSIVGEQLQKGAGYDEQQQSWAVCKLLFRMFGSGSQGANQARSQRDLLKQRPARELSETAQKERLKEREHEGGWAQE